VLTSLCVHGLTRLLKSTWKGHSSTQDGQQSTTDYRFPVGRCCVAFTSCEIFPRKSRWYTSTSSDELTRYSVILSIRLT